jgi:hypothetical protein
MPNPTSEKYAWGDASAARAMVNTQLGFAATRPFADGAQPMATPLKTAQTAKTWGKKACAPCGGALGHCALDRNCPIRQREEDKARAAYSTRPTHFETPSTSPPTCSQPSEEQQPRPQDTEPDEEGFLRVGCKRRRGKPTRASQANTSGMPSIASFLKVPSTQFSDSSPGSGSFSGSPPSPQQNTSPAKEIDNATAKPQSLW